MSGKALILPLAFLVLMSFGPGGPGDPVKPGTHPDPGAPGGILSLYHKADRLFQFGVPGPANDSASLAGFGQVIGRLERCPGFAGKDTLIFLCYLKKGILLDAKNDYTGAREAYGRALVLQKSIVAASGGFANDSLAFVLGVYAGTCYYNLNNFDSASYFLLRAESSPRPFHDPEDEVRMYNTLGALYYANGNYQQGKNYLSRGLEILEARQPLDTASLLGIESNMATSLYRLGLYKESLSIFHKILKYHSYTNYVYMNMGRAYAALGQYQPALACWRKVNPAQVPAVLNEMGHTQWQLGRTDSAAWFLDRLASGAAINELDVGINALYRADLLESRQQYMSSLASLQKAIILFSHNFRNPDIYSNPSNIAGAFAYYHLFDALFKKAVVFDELHKEQHKPAFLLASYEAYKASLSILRYIEKSYDTDDAKLFLKRKSGEVCQGALSVCLELHRLFPGDGYLEQAFTISEQNKASIITAGLKERAFSNIEGAEAAALQRERNIRYNIARLNVRGDEAQGSGEIGAIAREKAGYEIELTRLQKELEQNDHYYKLKYDDSSPGVKELQQRLSGQQALISCYTTAEALHIFIVTRTAFSYARIDSLAALQRDIEGWLNLLKTVESGKKFRGEAIGLRLYQRLVKPIQAVIPDKEEWIIIPDGILYFLPFESLPADAGSKVLLETTTISYQFSSRFVMNEWGRESGGATGAGNGGPGAGNATDRGAEGVLAFAPFAGAGAGPDRGEATGMRVMNFARLPGSREEISGLPGSQYIDSAATKERFLAEMNKYRIIHLATHAVSSVNNTSESFIAFYPQSGSSQVAERGTSPADGGSHGSDRLFLEELYGLNMNGTSLVIISACETGQGELVSNEGVISLARAFTYAGCESTINSLWKADDKATSRILRQFHVYLEKGYTKSRALREAKLDYLKSDAINKSPAFWSHLILIGDTGAVYEVGHPFRWSILALCLCILCWMAIKWKGREKKKSTSFTDPGF
jgi:CHAT domain-containing protein